MGRRGVIRGLVVVAVAGMAWFVAAQSPSATPSQAASAPVPAAGLPAPDAKVIEDIKKGDELVLSGKSGYTYDPAGRRDPFVDPLNKTKEEGNTRPEGWAGMLISEILLQGITNYGGEPIAVFRGTDNVGYFAREGDELWDGKIISINFDEGTVVFQQKVEDPSSPVRFRDVVKKINP